MQLAERMCKSNVINEDDKKYYAYSIQLLLEKLICTSLILVFAAICRSLIEIGIFLIVFALIRIYSDGIHCRTSAGCFISSVAMSISTIPISSRLLHSPEICQGGVMLSMIFIFYVGTIRNSNLEPTEQELNHLKKCSRIGITIIGLVVVILLLFFPKNQYVYYSALGIIYNAVSLLIAKLKGKEEATDDKA